MCSRIDIRSGWLLRPNMEALLPMFSAVRLTTDKFLGEGVGADAIGFVLEVFNDGYFVEFSRPEDGTTISLLDLKAADIEPAPEVMKAGGDSLNE